MSAGVFSPAGSLRCTGRMALCGRWPVYAVYLPAVAVAIEEPDSLLWAACMVVMQECQIGSASALQLQPAPQEQHTPLLEHGEASSLDGWNSVVSTR